MQQTTFYENVQQHQFQRQIVHHNWEKITLKSSAEFDTKSIFCCSEQLKKPLILLPELKTEYSVPFQYLELPALPLSMKLIQNLISTQILRTQVSYTLCTFSPSDHPSTPLQLDALSLMNYLQLSCKNFVIQFEQIDFSLLSRKKPCKSLAKLVPKSTQQY